MVGGSRLRGSLVTPRRLVQRATGATPKRFGKFATLPRQVGLEFRQYRMELIDVTAVRPRRLPLEDRMSGSPREEAVRRLQDSKMSIPT